MALSNACQAFYNDLSTIPSPRHWEGPNSSTDYGSFCIFKMFEVFFKFLFKYYFFFVKTTWFLSFSNKNDAESSRNFIKKQVLDPKRAKFVKKSLRKVYGKYTESFKTSKTCPGRPIWAHKGPYGPIYGPIRAHMSPYMGPSGPIWAPTRTGPQPGPGPPSARAPPIHPSLYIP